MSLNLTFRRQAVADFLDRAVSRKRAGEFVGKRIQCRGREAFQSMEQEQPLLSGCSVGPCDVA